ncbi:hypothetical protein MARINON1_50069 [Marinobacter salarius]|nr:hypothetical protein MBHK15_120069 [Marinobacter salarius]VXB30474.1 hypothetical protein MARINON1_50069 [Marinobacter salarius]
MVSPQNTPFFLQSHQYAPSNDGAGLDSRKRHEIRKPCEGRPRIRMSEYRGHVVTLFYPRHSP